MAADDRQEGMGGGRVAADALRLLIERAERLEEEKKGIQDDIKDVLGEAKGRGYEPKAIRRILSIRKKKKATRTCTQCGAAITRQSKSGLCHRHAMERLHGDPGYRQRRRAGLDRHFAQPEVKAACAARLAAWRETMPEQDRERLREWGRELVRRYLSRPDIHARSQSAEARAAAIAGNDAAKFGWCPASHREAYHQLVRSKKIPAQEARRIIEAEIEGTSEHARRVVASNQLAMRLRDERRQREAY